MSKTLILSAVLGVFAQSGHASVLLGYYTFSNGSGSTVTDQSGNGNSGTLSAAGATWVTGSGPDGGDAISLSEANGGFVNMGTVFGFGGTSGSIVSFTVQAWVDTNSNTPPNPVVVGNNVNASNEGYFIGIGNYDPGCTNSSYTGKASGYDSSGGGGCFGVQITPPSTTPVQDGNWHQLVLVDNAGTFSIYVDGSLEGTGSGPTGTLFCAGADFLVGAVGATGSCSTPGTPIAGYTGLISDVGVWNTALTQSQIEAAFLDPNNANAFAGTSTPEPASVTLATLGLGVLCLVARRRYGNNRTRRSSAII